MILTDCAIARDNVCTLQVVNTADLRQRDSLALAR
jgi:hypothetical protein